MKIELHIRTDLIIPNHPIPLEALLMKAFAIKEGFLYEETPQEEIPLPLEKHPDHELYLGSVSFIEGRGRYQHFFVKRYHGIPPKNVDISRGFFRAYKNKIFTLAPPSVITFYGRGDIEKIKELLQYITAIGAKRSQGYGKVQRVVVEEIDVDKTWIYNNQPMRAIPVRLLKDRINEWYYAAFNPSPPSYTTHQTEICFLPKRKDWLKISQ